MEENVISIFNKVLDEKEAAALDLRSLSFVGDAVESLFVRAYFVEEGNSYFKLHGLSSGVVNATTQSEESDFLAEVFTPFEADLFRRAKNKKTNTRAKNASELDYHKASGLEAVLGYLYLTGNRERLQIILDKIMEYVKQK